MNILPRIPSAVFIGGTERQQAFWMACEIEKMDPFQDTFAIHSICSNNRLDLD